MSDSHISIVEFPTAGNDPELNMIKVTAYRDSHNQKRAILFERSSEIKQILFLSQIDEVIEDIAIDLKIQFEKQDFIGTSYGLALAIASKQARLGKLHISQRIIATGIVGPGGTVQAVDGFDQKVTLIGNVLTEQDLFIYPAENVKSDTTTRQQIESLPCRCLAVSNLSELGFLWNESHTPVENSSRAGRPLRQFFTGLFYGMLSVALLTGFLVFQAS